MNEIEREKKVLNMMVSMHAYLGDKFKRYTFFIDLFLLISAVIINAFIFIDNKYFAYLCISAEKGQVYLGVFSILVFLLTMISILVNWREKAEEHKKACSVYSKLLDECRTILNLEEGEIKDNQIKLFENKYAESHEFVLPIPERFFIKLKHKHCRKLALSKYIDLNPEVPYLILKLKFIFKSF